VRSDAAVSMSTPIPASPMASGSAAAGIAATPEQLPLTSCQRGTFPVIAIAWFFDGTNRGALTFVAGSIPAEFALSPAATGLMSSMSFIGMFPGAGAFVIAAAVVLTLGEVTKARTLEAITR
jgi:putative MFS transporter